MPVRFASSTRIGLKVQSATGNSDDKDVIVISKCLFNVLEGSVNQWITQEYN